MAPGLVSTSYSLQQGMVYAAAGVGLLVLLIGALMLLFSSRSSEANEVRSRARGFIILGVVFVVGAFLVGWFFIAMRGNF